MYANFIPNSKHPKIDRDLYAYASNYVAARYPEDREAAARPLNQRAAEVAVHEGYDRGTMLDAYTTRVLDLVEAAVNAVQADATP